MNILLEVALTHAHKWRYKFNPQKCIYMMFGQDKEPEVAVVFGTSTVKQVQNTLYLGVPLSKDGSNEKRNNRQACCDSYSDSDFIIQILKSCMCTKNDVWFRIL